jgi:hypothetical protein
MHSSLLPQPSFEQDEPTHIFKWETAGQLDIMLPKMHLPKMDLLREDEGSMNYLFRILTGRYRNRILREGCRRRARYRREPEQLPLFPDLPNTRPALPDWDPTQDMPIRMRYQPAGMNLIRISFRVEEDVWLELRLLSLATRCSMSRLMVLMIVWEYARRYKFALRGWCPHVHGYVGTPTSYRLTLHYDESTRIYRITGSFSASTPRTMPRWYNPPPPIL